ncbi:MAG: alkaline phosphatase family protein [Planctomycetota bacterium]
MGTRPKQHRVVVIGWDGATWDLIDPWIAQGKLPNLAAFREQAAFGDLRSTDPPFTFPAWTSFLTGKNPGRHGVFDFTERVPGTHQIQFVNARRVRSKTIWRLLSDAGRRVACMGVPVTFPPEAVNGVLICGFDAPGASSRADESTFHPPQLLEEIRRHVGSYTVSANIMPLMNEDRHEEALDAILATLDMKGRTARYLLEREAWDVFMVLFGESDLIGHHFWRFCDPRSPLYTKSNSPRVANAIYEVYKKLDDMLPMLLEACPDDCVRILCSDHGFGGSGDRIIYMNKWLADEGFLAFSGGGPKAGMGFKLVNFAKLWGLKALPPSVKAYVFRKRQGIANRMESYLRFGGIDWSRTRAFSEELPYLQTIWINVKGREPQGVVDPGQEYDDLVAELKKRLLAWTDPATGEKVVTHVQHRDEIYDGPNGKRSPDLIVRTAYPGNYAYQGKSSRQGSPTAAIEQLRIDAPGSMKFYAAKSGTHRDYGILLAQGPTMVPGRRVIGARLMDVVPTILYLLGEPIPQDMDGVVLRDALRPEFVASRPVVSGEADTQQAGSEAPTYSEEDEAIISQRLQDLGYLE